MSKKLTITITPQGESKIEASGFAGAECLAATKSLEEAIGVTGEREMKGEATIALSTTEVTAETK